MLEGRVRRVTHKGSYVEIEVQFDKKRYTAKLPNRENLSEIKDRPCELELNKQVITKLVVNGVDLLAESFRAEAAASTKETDYVKNQGRSKPPSPVRQYNNPIADNNRSRQQANPTRGNDQVSAAAPYNFVPVDAVIIAVQDEVPLFDQYHAARLTGYIELDIQTLTPLYIADSNTADEESGLKDGSNAQNADFFSPGGIPKIPGSSLRGMTRTLVEIVSWSWMEYVDDQRLFYRLVAADRQSRLGNYYKDEMKNVKPGWLVQRGKRYFVAPAEPNEMFRVKKSTLQELGVAIDDFSSDISIYFKKPMRGKALVKDVSLAERSDYLPGRLVSSGPMQGKQSVWIVPEKRGREVPVESQVITEYKNDRNRIENANLLENLKENDVPCFYLMKKDRVTALGHTGNFRLPYALTVHEHLPVKHRDARQNQVLDLTHAIFGQVGEFAGRVFFEDAVLCPGQDKIYMEKSHLRYQSSPKPTTFQHYLEQGRRSKDALRNWNDAPDAAGEEARIRGYKMYWHRQTPETGDYSWVERDSEKVKDNRLVRAVKPGISFRGRIRFENLTAIELGSMLFVLDLREKRAHKLGMGKPLGLGSVRIKPSLTIQQRSKSDKYNDKPGRYQRLFMDGNWYLPGEKRDKDEYVKQFERFILDELGQAEHCDDIWKLPRLAELDAILNYENIQLSNWLERTRYLEIEHGLIKENEYTKCQVLARASRVVELASRKGN